MPKITQIQIKDLLGNISEVDQQILQFHIDCGSLNAQLTELIRKYPDQWVGVYKGQFIIAPTQDELIKQLGQTAKHAAITSLSSRPINLILLAA